MPSQKQRVPLYAIHNYGRRRLRAVADSLTRLRPWPSLVTKEGTMKDEEGIGSDRIICPVAEVGEPIQLEHEDK